MKWRGCKLDTITYNFLIECHCKDGKPHEAMKVLDSMVKSGCAPNPLTFNLIFWCITKSRDVNGVQRLYYRMKGMECGMNAVTYDVLMKMFVQLMLVNMVIKLRKEMDENEVEPNEYIWDPDLNVLRDGPLEQRLQAIFGDDGGKLFEAGAALYEMVLGQLRKAGELMKHEELVEKMVNIGFVARPL